MFGEVVMSLDAQGDVFSFFLFQTLRIALMTFSRCCASCTCNRGACTRTGRTTSKRPLTRMRRRALPFCRWVHRGSGFHYCNSDSTPSLPNQMVLQPLLLRRTKTTRGRDGKPILTLPSSDIQVVELTLDEAGDFFLECERNYYSF